MKPPITFDPKPATADSWWLGAPREGFSDKAEALFHAKQPPAFLGVTQVPQKSVGEPNRHKPKW